MKSSSSGSATTFFLAFDFFLSSTMRLPSSSSSKISLRSTEPNAISSARSSSSSTASSTSATAFTMSALSSSARFSTRRRTLAATTLSPLSFSTSTSASLAKPAITAATAALVFRSIAPELSLSSSLSSAKSLPRTPIFSLPESDRISRSKARRFFDSSALEE